MIQNDARRLYKLPLLATCASRFLLLVFAGIGIPHFISGDLKSL